MPKMVRPGPRSSGRADLVGDRVDRDDGAPAGRQHGPPSGQDHDGVGASLSGDLDGRCGLLGDQVDGNDDVLHHPTPTGGTGGGGGAGGRWWLRWWARGRTGGTVADVETTAVAGHHVGPSAVGDVAMAKLPEDRGSRDRERDVGLGGVGGQLHRGDGVRAHHVAHRSRRGQRRVVHHRGRRCGDDEQPRQHGERPAASPCPPSGDDERRDRSPPAVETLPWLVPTIATDHDRSPNDRVPGTTAPDRWSQECSKLGTPVDLEGEFVDVAPPPLLARLERLDQRMPGLVEVRGGVPVGRAVTAPHVAADHAQAEVDPPASDPAGSPRSRSTTV